MQAANVGHDATLYHQLAPRLTSSQPAHLSSPVCKPTCTAEEWPRAQIPGLAVPCPTQTGSPLGGDVQVQDAAQHTAIPLALALAGGCRQWGTGKPQIN